jgi:hypothetical protein
MGPVAYAQDRAPAQVRQAVAPADGAQAPVYPPKKPPQKPVKPPVRPPHKPHRPHRPPHRPPHHHHAGHKLPFTGAAVTLMTGIAVGLVMVGLVLVAVRRRDSDAGR